jgi:FtsP/CotA-like multicopper oxidase with cupredoxin domain
VLPGGTLDPTTVTKYVTPLVIPPAMPYTAGTGSNPDLYEIAVRQFTQQILPATFPTTTVWSYGSTSPAGIFHYPALTIEATWNRPIQVKWINDLIDPATGECLPHLLPVDQTLHWANPLGPRDSRGIDQTLYAGPVPIVTHLHGGEVNQESDGYPEAWYLPNCNIPGDIQHTTGTLYDAFKVSSPVGGLWEPGAAVFTYPNTQRATTLWYHDHALGMTRLNVYAGPAGFYLLRGGPGDQVTGTLPGPAPAPGDTGGPYYEIPIAIQDRSFNDDGSLFFPDNRAFFEGVSLLDLQIPFIPELAINGLPSDIAPIWNPESFGNMIVVNGKTWPYLEVEQRRYRFRFLNGTLARFLILTTDTDNNPVNGITPRVTFWQIGAEGGFLPAPVAQTQLLIANAERADVIVDFTAVPVGTTITLLNIAPDSPFGGGMPVFGCDPLVTPGCFEPSDANTTGQIMEFRVIAAAGPDPSTPPAQLVLPARTPLPAETVIRYLSLNESMSASVCVEQDPVTGTYVVPIAEVPCADPNAVPFGPEAARLGTLDPATQTPTVLRFMDGITETPTPGSIEVWEIWNFTEDAHPIHIHQVQFEVLGRAVQGDPLATSIAGSNQPMPWETGTKDTVIVYPGEITRVKAAFASPGLTVWHCHIIDHEDNEMMRPYCIANADGSLPFACSVANRSASGLIAAPAGSQIDLTWTDGIDYEEGFRIERAIVTGPAYTFTALATVMPNVTSYSDTTAAQSTTYAYQVVAFSMAGDAPPSNIAIATLGGPWAGSVSINGNAATTGKRGVVLTLSAASAGHAVTNMRFSWDGTTFYAWEPYSTARNATIPAGADGARTIYVQFRDDAASLSPVYSDSILFETAAPTGSVVINGDAAATRLRNAVLTLNATDALNTVTNMRFSWDGVTYYAWEAYATTRNVTLPAGDGTKTIYVQFRDAAGNVSTPYSDSIVLDQTAPTGSVVINGGAATTNSLYVNLALSATDALSTVTNMRLSWDGVTFYAWESYAVTRNATLPAGAGTKTISVQFRDALGNVSTSFTDSIDYAP